MKISVLSNGGWGTALARVLCDNSHEVTLWGREEEKDYMQEMQVSRENSRYLKGFKLPDSLQMSWDLKEAVLDKDLLILAAPTQFAGKLLQQLKETGVSIPPLVNVSKGIEVKSLKRISELVQDVFGDHPYADLAGPSHAEEVMRCIPTAVVCASRDADLARLVRDVFMNKYFRVYTSHDVIGIELGGALKNIFAIAAGVVDGMGYGDNTKAALMTRGIVEMARLGEKLGGEHASFNGLSGIGDLIVTCTSKHSRNRHVGEELGKGKSMELILEEMGHSVAEGVKTSQSAYMLARQLDVETPITDQIYAVLYEGKNSSEALMELMTRDAKNEL